MNLSHKSHSAVAGGIGGGGGKVRIDTGCARMFFKGRNGRTALLDLKTALTGVVLDCDKEEEQPEIWQLKQPSLSLSLFIRRCLSGVVRPL